MITLKPFEIVLLVGTFLAASAAVLFVLITPRAPLPNAAQAAQVIQALPPSLEGEAALVLDVQTGKILYEKNAQSQLPLASLTKIMTVFVARSVLEPTDPVIITEKALNREGEYGLSFGERWQTRDLIDFTLIESSNDGAQALADAAEVKLGHSFVDAMNTTAAQLSLSQTYFLDPTGLDESATMASAYGSARDVAHLLVAAVSRYPDSFSETTKDQFFVTSATATQEAHNTNEILDDIPGLIAGKTGYTDLAGGNLAILFDAGVGHPVAVVVLHSSREGRFTDVQKLVTFARERIQE